MTFLRFLMACSGAAACFGTAVVLVWCGGKAYGHNTLLTKSEETSSEYQDGFAAARSPTDSVPPFTGSSSCSARSDSDRFLMIVSTMDGYVTALNAVTGVEEWSVGTGTNPLLSSSISKLEMLRGGQRRRLIPSLDGGLFQFDGESIEPVPLAADILLSSSFRFTDDSTVVGGKDVETYGIDLKKGKVRYVCSASGCKYFDGHPASFRIESNIGDVLIVSRTTKTVRAVDLLTGAEKWNFSVGQHDLSYASPLPKIQEVTHEVVPDSDESRETTTQSSSTTTEKPPEVTADKIAEEKDSTKSGETEECSDQCDVQTEEDEIKEDVNDGEFVWSQPVAEVLDIDLKVIVPSGLVRAVDHLTPTHIHWQRKFKSPIAGAWVLRNKKLSEVGLFDSQNIPALEDQEETNTNSGCKTANCQSNADEPLLYIGAFEGQLYVQPSVRMMQEVEVATSTAIQHGIIDMPRVKWRPYVATAPSRTPAASVPKNLLAIASETTPQSTAVMQWHEQYPFEEGFYLFPDYTPVKKLRMLPGNDTTDSDDDDDDITVSLLNWWKEVLGISVAMSAVVNLLIHRCLRKNAASADKSPSQTESTAEPVVVDPSVDIPAGGKVVASGSCQQLEYTSRYMADFQQEACLGRGGFGVVFRARNCLDDCVYAIKRITLHDSDRARQKVTREVKALAKLDHPGIVRYYQSWFESPPPGWQEEHDKIWIDLSLLQTPGLTPLTPTGLQSSVGHVSASLVQPSKRIRRRKRAQPNPVNPMRPFESSLESRFTSELLSGVDELSNNEPLDHSSDISNTESGPRPSNSLHKQLSTDSGTENDSFEVAFQDDSFSNHESNEKLMNSSNSNNWQQSPRTQDSSLNIVFEDSAANPDCIPSTGNANSTARFGEPNVQFSSSLPDRPQTLELQEKPLEKLTEPKSRTGKEPDRKLYLYIQMQLCQTESLKDWLNSNTLNRDKYQLRDIFHQIVSAIGYVHDCGMMHRDLKPSNIFFAMDGSVKIGDFGLVTAVEENCSDNGFVSPVTPGSSGRHTDQVGTKLYMSPEQCAGQNYTHKVDIYALGMIFFELFYPFATAMERIKVLVDVRQLKFPPRFLRELAEEANFVRPLLSHEPDTRPSAKEILQAPIVVDFEEASQAIRRLHSQSRLRTMSSSSGNSHGDGSSQKCAEETVGI